MVEVNTIESLIEKSLYELREIKQELKEIKEKLTIK